MIRNRIALAATLLAIFSYAPAHALVQPTAASPAPTTAACLLASNLVAKRATDLKDRDLAKSTLLFFLGRINDRMTTQQLKSELQQQGHLITKETLVPLMNACLHVMQAKSQMLQSAGEQLQRAK